MGALESGIGHGLGPLGLISWDSDESGEVLYGIFNWDGLRELWDRPPATDLDSCNL